MKRKNPYLHMGIAAFFTICAALLFYDTLFGSRVLLHIWQQFLFAVEPIPLRRVHRLFAGPCGQFL